MPLVTGAIAAVTAAVAVTSFATVATAVVAVSAVVGVAGLAVSVVGMATGNKDLLKAGEILSYVGLAGGLIGGGIGGVGALVNGTGTFLQGAAGAYSGAAQHVSQAWDDGIGSWFAAAPAKGATNSATSAVNAVDDVANPNFVQAPGTVNGVGQSPVPGGPVPTAIKDLDVIAKNASQATPGVMAPVSTNQAATGFQQTVSSATKAPFDAATDAAKKAAEEAAKKAAEEAAKKTAGGVPDWMLYSGLTTAGQAGAGALSGMFAGDSAEQQMELERLKNEQAQAQLALTNKRSNYAPKISFNNGIMAR